MFENESLQFASYLPYFTHKCTAGKVGHAKTASFGAWNITSFYSTTSNFDGPIIFLGGGDFMSCGVAHVQISHVAKDNIVY